MLVEVWSDVMCPWCYIGKRRLEASLRLFDGRDQVEVTWRSYELRPDQSRTPGMTLGDIMMRYRGLTGTEVTKLFTWIRKLGAEEGLLLNLENVRPVNSFDAHRLTHLAGVHGLRDQMIERLFRAHLTDNVNVADVELLVAMAGEVGIDVTAARTILAGDAYAADVITEARNSAVSAVPTFVVDQEHTISGAPASGDLLTLLERARSESAPVGRP